MLKWQITFQSIKRKAILVLTDIKICEAVINDPESFKRYCLLIQDDDMSKSVDNSILNQIIRGIGTMNWEGYFG